MKYIYVLLMSVLSISQLFAAEYAVRCDNQKGYPSDRRYDIILVDAGSQSYFTEIYNHAYSPKYIVVEANQSIRLKHLSINEKTIKLKKLGTSDYYHKYKTQNVVPSQVYGDNQYNVSRKGDMIVSKSRAGNFNIKNCHILSKSKYKKALARSKRNFADLKNAVREIKKEKERLRNKRLKENKI